MNLEGFDSGQDGMLTSCWLRGCGGEVGGIVEKEMPLQISNVALFNAATQKADRVGFKVLEDGKKVRIFKSTGEVVDA